MSNISIGASGPASIAELETKLRAYIGELQAEFIARFLPANPLDKPTDFQHSVKAYCVLSHAAFEEFVETISLNLMHDALGTWLNNRRATDTLVALCMFYEVTLSANDDEDSEQARCFDAVRTLFDDLKRKHSTAIINNHGFSLKYLRQALTPVFVDVSQETQFLESLRVLADARGSFAHKQSPEAIFTYRRKAQRPMTPETARDVVSDCLELCKQISNSAARLYPVQTEPHEPLLGA